MKRLLSSLPFILLLGVASPILAQTTSPQDQSSSGVAESSFNELFELLPLASTIQRNAGPDTDQETLKALVKMYAKESSGKDLVDGELEVLLAFSKGMGDQSSYDSGSESDNESDSSFAWSRSSSPAPLLLSLGQSSASAEDAEEAKDTKNTKNTKKGNAKLKDQRSKKAAKTGLAHRPHGLSGLHQDWEDSAPLAETFLKTSEGFSGLENLGNTCFLNGALKLVSADGVVEQVASNYLAVSDALQGTGKDVDHAKVIKAQRHLKNHLQALLVEIKRMGAVASKTGSGEKQYRKVVKLLKKFIADFKQVLAARQEKFAGQTSQQLRLPGSQNDPDELLGKVLDYIGYQKHAGMALSSTMKWDNEAVARLGQVSKNSILPLTVKEYQEDASSPMGVKEVLVSDLQQSVDKFFTEERVGGSRENGNVEGSKGMKLLNSPESIIVNLKRFDFNMLTGRSERLGHRIAIKELVLPLHNEAGVLIGQAHYGPQSVEVHHGAGTSSGHYYTYIKSPKGWVVHNDSSKPRVVSDALDDIERNGYLVKYKLLKKDLF